MAVGSTGGTIPRYYLGLGLYGSRAEDVMEIAILPWIGVVEISLLKGREPDSILRRLDEEETK